MIDPARTPRWSPRSSRGLGWSAAHRHLPRRPLRPERHARSPAGAAGSRAEPSRRFDRAEAEQAKELARRIAVALEAERVAAREYQLNSAAAALATAATGTEAAAALTAALRDALQAGVVAVYTSAPERPDRLVLQHHMGSADIHAVLDPARTGRRWPAVDAVRTGSPIWLNDERAWSTRYPHLADDTVPVVAAATLPLRVAGHTLGAVTLAFPYSSTPTAARCSLRATRRRARRRPATSLPHRAAKGRTPPSPSTTSNSHLGEAVEHAYGPDDDGRVRYRITARTDGGLDVAVDDDGTWRPPPADRGFRGRGIEMIRRLGAEAAIDVEDSTHVRFTVVPAVGPPVRSAATTARRPDAPAELDTSHDPDGRLRLGLAGDIDLDSVAGLRTACSPRSTAPRRPRSWTCAA